MNKVLILLNKNNVQLKDEILGSFGKETLDKIQITSTDINELEIVFPDDCSKYYDLIAYKIAAYIVENVEEKLVTALVMQECDGLLLEEEIQDIITKVKWELIYSNDKKLSVRIGQLHDEIVNMFKINGIFDLVGYLRFRFKNRQLEIREKIDIAIDDFLDDKDVTDFTNMVNHFVSIQIPKLDYVHIIATSDGKYEILTSEMERINLNDLEALLIEINATMGQKFSMEDLVISSLMSLLPRDIYIHFNDRHDPRFPMVLEKIYAGRSFRCDNCDVCEHVREEAKTNKKPRKRKKKKEDDKHEDVE